MLPHLVGDEEFRLLGPAVDTLRLPDLVFTERLAVGRARVLLRRRPVADVAVDDDERGAVVRIAERLERAVEHLEIVGVPHARDVPAVGDEARRHVLGEREARAPLDRDPVVVVDPAEVRQAEVAGERRGLRRDPLHHAAVAGQRVHVVVEQLDARTVVARREPAAADRHPDARRHALPQRPGGGLDAGRPAILGMAGALALELAEAPDIVEGDRRLPEPLVVGVHRLDAGQVQHGVEQHRRVAGRQHEPVAVRPDGVVGIEAQPPLPERVDDRRQGHRRAGVAGARRLHGVHRQRPDRVDAQTIEIHITRHRRLLIPHAIPPPRRRS